MGEWEWVSRLEREIRMFLTLSGMKNDNCKFPNISGHVSSHEPCIYRKWHLQNITHCPRNESLYGRGAKAKEMGNLTITDTGATMRVAPFPPVSIRLSI